MDIIIFYNLAENIMVSLKEKNLTIAAAESCTGGLVSAAITQISGSSAVYKGGVISYTNAVKSGVLGVSEQDIESFTPVSETVARQMAQGVRCVIGADVGVSVTGLAGPDGDLVNPVGRVYIGLAAENFETIRQFDFPGDREQVRAAAVFAALEMVRGQLETTTP